MQEMLAHLSHASGAVEHPYFEEREVKRSVLVVFCSDRGLCGSFNSNIIRRTTEWLREREADQAALFLIGKKSWDFFRRRDVRVLKHYQDFQGKMDLGKVRQITNDLTGLFLSHEADEIHFLYTAFLSLSSFRITQMRFLPIRTEFGAAADHGSREYIFEPDPGLIYRQLLPHYAQVLVQMALAESLASEHGTRMLAMSAATSNAGEMIDHLTLVRNKARQAFITKELLDIVSGAEALNK
jgi:F-type H+-transporting ATPase subunit gamma